MSGGFEFVWPWLLLLLPLPLVVRRVVAGVTQRDAALTVPDVRAFRLPESTAGFAPRRHWGRLLLLTLIWLALLAAAARPQWTGAPVALPTSGRDLMLAVDISGSMGYDDMVVGGQTVSRLVAVKAVVTDFIERRAGDRVGLILFGTQAYLQAPLTFDLTSVNRLLDEAPVGIAGGKTAIGDAVGLAVKRLRVRPQEQRVLILLTDGANNVGEVAPLKAAELAATEAIRIYTIGIGGERRQRLLGRIINPSADLDEETLTEVARATGGRYFRARNPQQLEEIYDIIDALEPLEQEADTYRPRTALYYWPLGLALIGFVALSLAATTRTRIGR